MKVNHAEQHVAGLESELQFHASKCEDAKAAVADAHASVADTTKQLSEKRDAIKVCDGFVVHSPPSLSYSLDACEVDRYQFNPRAVSARSNRRNR